MNTKKIAAYLRISVDTEQDRDNTSIENQRSIITNYVNRKFPDTEVDFYADRDRSGYTFEQRENYMQMRPLLMSGYYDTLIIKDFSRFSRRNSKGLVELEDLRDAGIRIISIGDGIDYPTYDDWNNIQVRFLLNEMPVTDASKKVRNVISNRQEAGKWICSVPFGYHMTNTKNMTFNVDPPAAEVVKKIFDLYISGWGYKRIANYLTDNGIPTPRMREKELKESNGTITKIKPNPIWSIPSIQKILINDFYIGTLRQGKFTRIRINGPDRKIDESDHKVFENNHQAIVDFRTFAKTQELMKTRTTNNYRGVKKYDTSYSGFLICGDCGHPMFSLSRSDMAPAYICGLYHKRGLKGCTAHHTRIDLLDTIIKEYLTRIKRNAEDMIKELNNEIKNEPKRLKKSQTAIEMLEFDLEKAREEYKAIQKQKVKELMKATNEKLVEEIYSEMEAELEAKIDGIESQIQLANEKRNTTIQVNRIARTVLEIFDDIVEKDKLDSSDLSFLLEKIEVYKDRFDITLKSDVQMLLSCGMQSYESHSFELGKVTINFNWDTESIEKATIVQSIKHRADKAFSVNIVNSGDPLEIFTSENGGVVLKKYSALSELEDFASHYAESLAKTSGHITFITDRDSVIAVSGAPRKEFYDKHISEDIERIMEERSTVIAKNKTDGVVPVLDDGENHKFTAQVITPIVANGDAIGTVVMLETDSGAMFGEAEKKLTQSAACVLGKQFEQY